MARGKKLTIALAIAIPLLALGGGLAMASTDAAGIPAEEQSYSPTEGTVVSYGSSAAQYGCGDCAGECGAYGNGLCDRVRDGDCTGNCADCPVAGQCAGYRDCIRSGDCAGSAPCDGSGQCVGAGQCRDAAPKRLNGCAGSCR